MQKKRLIDANAFDLELETMEKTLLGAPKIGKDRSMVIQMVRKTLAAAQTILPTDAKQKWHQADELPPLHEESLEDDDEVIRSMISDPVLVLLKDGNVKIAQLDHSKRGDYWFDDYGTAYNQSVAYWMMLPERPEE